MECILSNKESKVVANLIHAGNSLKAEDIPSVCICDGQGELLVLKTGRMVKCPMCNK